MGAPIDILVVAVGTGVCSLLLAVTFGRCAARADESSERLLADYVRELSLTIAAGRLDQRSASTVSYAGLAGLAAAHETISREPSITTGR